MGNLISFMKEVADGLRESGNYGTAHIYRSSLSAILAFHGSDKLPFRKVSQEFLKSFESYLRGRNCSWNTVSTYMRTLRAVYNRAVDRHLAPYVPHHFRYVYTGTRADRKRALDKEDMERLMKELPKQLCQDNKELQRTRGLFFLMFLLRGIPFVDLAYLKKHDIDGECNDLPPSKNRQVINSDSCAGSHEADQAVYEYRSCFSLSFFADHQWRGNGSCLQGISAGIAQL